MSSIAFVDTEIEPKTREILDIGSIRDDGSIFHNASVAKFKQFIKGAQYVCGHNILNHDLKYIGGAIIDAGVNPENAIDTLHLSPLLFPTQPYHHLVKDDKLQTDDANNPLNDSIKAKDLLYDEIAAFKVSDQTLQKIFYLLLKDRKEFQAFFRFIQYTSTEQSPDVLISQLFENEICDNAGLTKLITAHPVESAYCLALIHSYIRHKNTPSITPPWVLRNYPEVAKIMFRLRDNPCIRGCAYCNKATDIKQGLKRFFGFDDFRKYAGEPLQEMAAKAAIENKSILTIFPTGGGKSITFQLPALMSGENSRGLTIIISPLQSLMKDQVDNLEKTGITEAVTINGLLDPIERAKSFERVEDGSASILYISPESLRSKSIERLVLGRKISRFVIDEAHCFSSWGQDFRVDYLYIGDFIRNIQKEKNLTEPIPVSCFTATAKQKVIQDIRDYFKEKLSLNLELFVSRATRTNLHYKVFEMKDESEKYLTLRNLIEEKGCPTIVYVSRTRRAYDLAKRLTEDGFDARPYHGKMEKQEKTQNQDSFINGETQVMVATSAFGMGVDKKDVEMVVHYEISDSLENYVQEAGRAGRDENISAECYVLFNEEDLSKHFILLNQTKLSIKEIQQIWRAIKELTKFRSEFSNSALEIARKAGWEDSIDEIETRVKTAIAALEDAGYLRRGLNMPKIFANSILTKNAQEAINKINKSEKFDLKQKENAVRIIKKLFSAKNRKQQEEEAESRVDYISDHLGIVKQDVIHVIQLLREEKILADTKDLTAFIRKGENKNRPLKSVENFIKLENFLLTQIGEQEKIFNLKELIAKAEEEGCEDANIQKIKTILNIFSIKHWIKRKHAAYSKNHVAIVSLYPIELLREKMQKRHELARFIIEYLFQKTSQNPISEDLPGNEEPPVEFSVHELKSAFENSLSLFKSEITIDDVEDTLFYLSRTEAIKIEGGFLVIYNAMHIERTGTNNKKGYTKEDYQKLEQFYENKVQQIHIVGEYAKRMIHDYKGALQFVEDYFQLNYSSFLHKYFKGSRQNEINRTLTPAKFRQLFGSLSTTQLKIINDSESKYIVVAAGPGSGKTRVLVHKLASLLLMEDVKHEQLLMLTFSRAAATEFKKRLISLIGNAAHYIEIKTFHSYCFDLSGRVGSLDKSDLILKKTIEKIRNKEVETSRITKTVLVIDEAQDMDKDEFELINTLMQQNEEMRVIAVGDDDQNIFEFRGSSSKYLEEFIHAYKAVKYEMIENFRSKSNLVDFTNQYVKQIESRLKYLPVIAIDGRNGKIKIVHYQSNNLISPVVDDILATGLSGSTCVLTKTNEEALQITGQLLKNGLQAKLIQTNDGFNLFNLDEVRFFFSQLNPAEDVFVINDEIWNNAKRALVRKFSTSTRLALCKNIIKDFEATNPKKKYRSDFEVFIRESKPEDFYNDTGEIIFVSTIHKAKGKEFDNVFIMLDNFAPQKDEDKRILYVAMTRAKQNLVIHYNGQYLHQIKTENMETIENKETYQPPDTIAMHLTHKDIWLDYFIRRQYAISKLVSGDSLVYDEDKLVTEKGRPVLKFSNPFKAQIEAMKQKGFELKEARVNYILYWKKEETNEEIKIILPEILFEKIKETKE